MGYKKVCFTCRKAFSIYLNEAETTNLTCPECGNPSTILNQKFKPPRREDVKQWEVAKFLSDNGFTYQNVYREIGPGVKQQIAYPKNMEGAKEFVRASKETNK